MSHVKGRLQSLFDATNQLLDTESKPIRKIGFDIKEGRAAYSGRQKTQQA